MFAYEREDDDAIVLAGGIPRAWIETADGVAAKRLPTPYGVLSYALTGDAGATRMQISGELEPPAGGLVLDLSLPAAIAKATVNGAPAEVIDGRVVLRALPADVVVEH